MKSFENPSIYIRDIIRAGLVLIALGVGWATMQGDVGALDDRVGAAEARQVRQDAIVEQIREDVFTISKGQAVLTERINTVIRQTEKTDEKLDRILERLSDR